MSDTSPDPKPLTDDELHNLRNSFKTSNLLSLQLLANVTALQASLAESEATITTLRASLDTVQADARLRLAEASASLGEAEKRAGEACRTIAVCQNQAVIDGNALSASEGLVAVLREAAEELYAECHGPDETGERHLCNHCGVDVSMRGIEAEATEHDERCPAGKLAKAMFSTPATRTPIDLAEFDKQYRAAKFPATRTLGRTPGTVEVCSWRGPIMGFHCTIDPLEACIVCVRKDCPITRPAAAGEGT